MENYQPCKIEGMRSVKIRMFNDVNWTLTHVRFIPDMWKNLILMAMLDSHDLEWSSRQGVLDVKSNDKVKLRVYKHNDWGA